MNFIQVVHISQMCAKNHINTQLNDTVSHKHPLCTSTTIAKNKVHSLPKCDLDYNYFDTLITFWDVQSCRFLSVTLLILSLAPVSSPSYSAQCDVSRLNGGLLTGNQLHQALLHGIKFGRINEGVGAGIEKCQAR